VRPAASPRPTRPGAPAPRPREQGLGQHLVVFGPRASWAWRSAARWRARALAGHRLALISSR
jgi:hypothetical protein